MAQRLVEKLDSIETEELFIEETAKLAILVVEQKENPVFKSECHVAKGPGTKESSASKQSWASEEELEAARNLGMNLYGISKKYQKELTEAFDERTTRIGASLWDINYEAFSTICNTVLHRTITSVADRWDQSLLVFANYMQLREGLQGDTSRQNEIASYIGRYLTDMGFQTWIQLQGGWKSVGKILSGTSDPPICPPEGSAV